MGTAFSVPLYLAHALPRDSSPRLFSRLRDLCANLQEDVSRSGPWLWLWVVFWVGLPGKPLREAKQSPGNSGVTDFPQMLLTYG